MKPIIGITRNRRPADYEQAVRIAGGEPLLLDWERTSADAALETIDGLLLTGGGDVHPRHYGETLTPDIQLAEPGRDEFEIALIHGALERDLPMLAICRGVQVLNVAGGGSLVKDISGEIDTSVDHSLPQPKNAIAHDIRIETGSRLADALGPQVRAAGTCAVNSRHHQAIRKVAPGYVVSATAPDGVVEAIERPDRRFCVGVEWHPENFWQTGEFKPLFDAFVRACEKPATRR
jgi:putative glutamine amidotransferase